MNQKSPLELVLSISFASAASLPALRRPDGGAVPYISGSTLKGAIKVVAERILDLNEIVHCSGSERLESCESKPCLICSLFGHRLFPGKIVFEGGTLLPASETGAAELQRKSRTRAETVRAFAPQTFTARLVALYPLTTDEEQLLLMALGTIRTLGGGKTQGLGFCSIEVEKKESKVTEALPKVEALEGEGSEIGIILVAEGPICIAKSPAGKWYRESLHYLPGAAIKSAFHDQLNRLEHLGVVGTEMVNAFLAPSVSFSDCLPVGCSDTVPPQSERQPLELPFVLPYSATSPTSDLGNWGDGEPPDTLIRRFVLSECHHSGFPYVVGRASTKRVFDQVVRSDSHTVWRDQLVFVPSDVASFCPVERLSKRSAPEYRHSVSFMHPHTVFAGTIRKLRPVAKEALKRLATEKLSVGALRSRGFGRLSLAIVQPPVRPDISRAVGLFNEAIESELKRWGRAWDGVSSISSDIEKDGRVFFSIGLLSDLMLPKWTFWDGSEATPFEKLLSEAGIPAQEVLPFWKFGAKGGWNAACQAPHGLTAIIRRGSVCLFETRVPEVAKQEGLYAKLENIQDTGLGLRTGDGFGAIAVCSAFHTMGYLDS